MSNEIKQLREVRENSSGTNSARHTTKRPFTRLPEIAPQHPGAQRNDRLRELAANVMKPMDNAAQHHFPNPEGHHLIAPANPQEVLTTPDQANLDPDQCQKLVFMMYEKLKKFKEMHPHPTHKEVELHSKQIDVFHKFHKYCEDKGIPELPNAEEIPRISYGLKGGMDRVEQQIRDRLVHRLERGTREAAERAMDLISQPRETAEQRTDIALQTRGEANTARHSAINLARMRFFGETFRLAAERALRRAVITERLAQQAERNAGLREAVDMGLLNTRESPYQLDDMIQFFNSRS